MSAELRKFPSRAQYFVSSQIYVDVQRNPVARRVQWFRARAEMQYFQKDVEILSQEFWNATDGFTWMDVWSSLEIDAAGSSPATNSAGKAGAVAYAKQKASMFRRMAEDCTSAFSKLDGTWPVEGEKLADHVLALRPSQMFNWAVTGYINVVRN
ncbi:hypothetical protein DFH09DRAFT_1071489 [Mycena vulgaris]|nr:hypothetical protein DFH09DRAFT_1071489 [Mycena vulgaris]